VRLINDMLDIDKIESGKVIFNFRPTDIVPLLQLTLEANQTYAEQFGVRFRFEDEIGQATVNVDSDRFMQVVTNLLSNAVKFSPAESEVKLNVSRIGSNVRIKVTDQGRGIPEKYRGRIFQKFVQLGAIEDRQKGGTGLGLSISKAIVEKLGGTIGFESEENRGTTFYFDLPEWKDG
jgi:signal transduction histidine kinase